MKEHPILFSAPMVRAILDGTKTQTRRVVKPQPVHRLVEGLGHITIGMNPADDGGIWYDSDGIGPGSEVRCPYGVPGDHLWVKETWKPHCEGEISPEHPLGTCVKYRADGACIKPTQWTSDQGAWCEARESSTHWRPSIFMPRWASRITLEIVSLKVERLQDISEEDAKAEGVHPCADALTFANKDVSDAYESSRWRGGFQNVWDSINGKAHPWDSNVWVWVVEFKRI